MINATVRRRKHSFANSIDRRVRFLPNVLFSNDYLAVLGAALRMSRPPSPCVDGSPRFARDALRVIKAAGRSALRRAYAAGNLTRIVDLTILQITRRENA